MRTRAGEEALAGAGHCSTWNVRKRRGACWRSRLFHVERARGFDGLTPLMRLPRGDEGARVGAHRLFHVERERSRRGLTTMDEAASWRWMKERVDAHGLFHVERERGASTD